MKKNIKKLIKRVRKIDKKAAEYLKNEAPKLSTYDPNAYTVDGIINWAETLQGHEYWEKIYYRAIGNTEKL